MQINLLRESLPAFGEFNRQICRARSKKCIVPGGMDFNRYRNWPRGELEADPILKMHVENVCAALDMEGRKYNYLSLSGGVDDCTIFIDSHNDLEKLGAQQYFTGKVIVVSMDDFLDVALRKRCGADPDRIRKIEDYDTVSPLFLNFALHRAKETVYMDQFRGYDPNFDAYLDGASRIEFSENPAEELPVQTVLRRIYYGVIESATTILTNCVRVLTDRFHLAVRSQGFANYVLSPVEPSVSIPEYIDYTDKDVEFRLPVLTLARMEYADRLAG